MRNIKLTIQYDGTDFSGWQVQNNAGRTVQGEIENVLHRIFKKKTNITASGRTDSGVHALGQVANFHTASAMTENQIQRAINSLLPPDISITAVEEVPLSFHSRFDAKQKTYRYSVLNRAAPSPIDRRYSLHYPYKIDLKLMRQASEVLTGRHDFRSFTATDPFLQRRGRSKDSVRTVLGIDIKKKGDFIFIDITSEGFLYKMVRNIVGILLDAASRRISIDGVRQVLEARNRTLSSETAKSCGLTLINVVY